MKTQTIETIAKVLLQKKISFVYESDYLRVTDQVVKYELFETAQYHTKTKELVLQCTDYTKCISFNQFLEYFGKVRLT